MSTATDKLAYIERLKSRRATYDPQLQECATYIRPIRGNVTSQTTEGSPLKVDVFDSTALDANRKLGARLSSTLCSPAIKWFDVVLDDPTLSEDEAIAVWLEAARDAMLREASQSLFYPEVNEAFCDAPGLGTGGVFVDEVQANGRRGFPGLYVRSVGVGEIAVDEGADGLVDVVARDFTLSARAALKRWPKGLSVKTADLATKKPEEQVQFVHLVEPRAGAAEPKVNPDGTIPLVPAARLPWASYYLEPQTKHLVEEGGYHEMPYAVMRWSRPAGWLYGYGIGHDALGDIKALNKSRELFERQWALAIQPPTKTRRNIGKVRQVPGGMNPVLNPDDITEFVTNARFDVGQAGINDLRASIRAMWFDDQLQLKDSPQMTAAEVYARMELMLQLLGPNGTRAMFEFFDRIIQRMFGLHSRAGAFPPVPQALAEHVRAEGRWHVRYQSPLARAQRTPELTAIDRTISAAGSMIATFPEVVDVIKADDVIREVADVAGVPKRLLRTDEEVAQIRQVRTQQQAQQQALANANVIADSAGKVAPLIRELKPQQVAA